MVPFTGYKVNRRQGIREITFGTGRVRLPLPSGTGRVTNPKLGCQDPARRLAPY